MAHKKYLLQEWEVYVLAKLNWNVPGLVATDFVDHILKVRAVFLLVNQMNHCLLIGYNRALSLAVFGALPSVIQFTRAERLVCVFATHNK